LLGNIQWNYFTITRAGFLLVGARGQHWGLGLLTLDLGIPGLPPFPPLPPSFSPPLPPSTSRGPHPLNQLGVLGSAVSSPSGVWDEAPADKRFGAYLSQKEQLWWQQLLCIFIRINLNFCTNTIIIILVGPLLVGARGHGLLDPLNPALTITNTEQQKRLSYRNEYFRW